MSLLTLAVAALALGAGGEPQPYPVLVEQAGTRVYARAEGRSWGLCPRGALAVRARDLDGARKAVLLAVPRLYRQEKLVDVRGARARAARLGAAEWTRGGLARSTCGAEVARRTIAVAVGFPRVTWSASLSSATFFVSRVADGWVIWHQAH